jgi:hypothetical protein
MFEGSKPFKLYWVGILVGQLIGLPTHLGVVQRCVSLFICRLPRWGRTLVGALLWTTFERRCRIAWCCPYVSTCAAPVGRWAISRTSGWAASIVIAFVAAVVVESSPGGEDPGSEGCVDGVGISSMISALFHSTLPSPMYYRATCLHHPLECQFLPGRNRHSSTPLPPEHTRPGWAYHRIRHCY